MASTSLLIAGSAAQFAKLKYNIAQGRKKFLAMGKPESCKYLKKSEESGATEAAFETLKADPSRMKKAAIMQKLKSGKKISQAELDWLEANAPELYEKAKKILEERAEYEQKLRECRTKHDVAMAKVSAMSDIQRDAPKTPDADASETALMRIAAVHDEHAAFTSSARYKNLPEKDAEAEDAADEKRRDKQKARGSH